MTKGSLALTYHIEGVSGVPSDNVPHQTSIVVLPTIRHLTVPKVQQAAHLQATPSLCHWRSGPLRRIAVVRQQQIGIRLSCASS